VVCIQWCLPISPNHRVWLGLGLGSGLWLWLGSGLGLGWGLRLGLGSGLRHALRHDALRTSVSITTLFTLGELGLGENGQNPSNIPIYATVELSRVGDIVDIVERKTALQTASAILPAQK